MRIHVLLHASTVIKLNTLFQGQQFSIFFLLAICEISIPHFHLIWQHIISLPSYDSELREDDPETNYKYLEAGQLKYAH
jgi:hypothetical protein